MVWRKIICFAVAIIACVLPMATHAFAAEPYDGTINTSYITIFKDIATKIDIDKDYVFYRSGQYEYQMVVGDLHYSTGQITADGLVEIYIVSTNSSNYNSGYEYFVTSENGFSLTLGSSLVYSNLGAYPDLIERNDYNVFTTNFLLVIAICLYVLRSIFSFCLRKRN